MNPVAILGAGITGLSAAHYLKKRHIPTVIYEAGPRAGGAIQTFSSGGFVAEGGPNTIMETSPAVGELVKELGLGDRKMYSSPNAANRYICRRGKLLKVPGSPLEFFDSKLFSFSAKARLFAEPFITRARREESVAQFVRRRLGREFLDYAINPLAAGIYAGDPEKLSIRHAFPKVYEQEERYSSLILGQILGARERKRTGAVSKQNAPKFSFPFGLVELISALFDEASDEVHFNCRVERLAKTREGWNVTISHGGASQTEMHSAVLSTIPAHALADIPLEGFDPSGFSPLANIRYTPVASLSLGFRRADIAHPLDGFGALFPAVENLNSLGVIFASSLFPGRAPAGHELLTLYIGGARQPDLVTKSKTELVSLAMEDLRKVLGVSGPPVFSHVWYHHHAIPQYEMNYPECLEIMNSLEAHAPGLFLAGNFRKGVSVADSIVSASNMADRIETYFHNHHTSADLLLPA